ncbi:ROK family transcriptional regulator [Micromonospora rubida]|uniref:ROK family transcriptional regulator n=1 Tax=Micromonospora rubida TaxID=2697657 RepID=UPI001376C4AA|nr:ROK family transcriptional regulator [Micromonospora rubida]NBE83530.1 ROK family protein [Micromonospora rubida]
MTRPAGSSKLLRAMNESAILAHLLDHGPLTRGELRELTGLSKPTTSDVLRSLTDAGLTMVVGRSSGGPGPNAEIYSANPKAGFAVAICIREVSEIPGPSLIAALIDAGGVVHARIEDSIDLTTLDPVDAITDTVTRVIGRAGVGASAVRHVTLGVPGSYDAASGVIHYIDVPGFDRPGLVERIAARLGTVVEVENDVNLAAIAERTHGVAAGGASFTLFWIGDGLGLAIDLGGTLLRGGRGGAGEIGYVPVSLPSDCPPADLQSLIGGPAVVALAAEHDIAAATPGAAIGVAVASAHPRAGRFLDAVAARIALGLAAVAGVLDPPLIVLAGDVAQAGGEALAQRVRAALPGTTPLDITIAVTEVTDDAVLLGALEAGRRAVRESLIDNQRTAMQAG